MRVTGGLPTGLGNDAGVAGAIAAEPDWSKFRPGGYGQLQKGKPAPGRQPVLPGENPANIQDVYGPAQSPGQRFLPQAGAGGFPMIAQIYPGGQPVGNQAGMLGAPMQMGPTFGPKPFNLDANIVTEADKTRLESIGGSANIQLDPNQALRLGANFIPGYTDEMGMQVPQQFGIKGQYETPGFGINVNYRNRGRMPGPSMGGGFPGQIDAGFQGRF